MSILDTPIENYDDAFVQEVSALPPEEQVKRVAAKLKELNPQFDGQVTANNLENPGWAEIKFSARSVRDISPVRALTWLKLFTCNGTQGARPEEFSNLSPLHGLKLRKVDCAFTQVSDLSPLRGMPLKDATFYCCPITDLSPLEGCPLENLGLGGLRIKDLTPLRKFRLTGLNLCDVPVSDLSPLGGMWLTSLNLANTKARDLTPLQGMPLTWLNCSGTEVSDLSPLRGAPLATFSCHKTGVTDLSPLHNAPLQAFKCDPEVAGQPANAKILRGINTLEIINNLPAAEFWKQAEAGNVPRP